MSELLWVATGDDEVVGHADWVEVHAMFKADQSASREDLSRAIHRAGTAGVRARATEDRARDLADQAFAELSDRASALGTSGRRRFLQYPFELVENDQVLRFRPLARSRPFERGLLYLFLLAITRHSMDTTKRVCADIDPTKLFERVCAEVLFGFWGGADDRCGKLIVGTARRKEGDHPFPTSVSTLCRLLKEGGEWKKDARSPGAGDAGLDVAVWRRFRDERPGSLVGFAQCKTGENWRRDLAKLRPRAFCGNYMTQPLLIDPQAIYMVPCRINRDRWSEDTRKSEAILFDRCRLVEYGHAIGLENRNDCNEWLDKAVPIRGATG